MSSSTSQIDSGMLITGCIATVAASETLSSAINNIGMGLLGIFIPSNFTGTTITFETTLDGTNYVPVCDHTGAAISLTVAPSKYIAVDPTPFYGLLNYKMVVASQATAATLTFSQKG